MRPWTVDADDITIAEDFDDALLHKTPWIDGFLTPQRDDKFVVIGTKGFGKTLLLKAKRVRYQHAGDIICIPDNALLDKPVGDKIFSRDMLELYATSTEWWAKVWLLSIAAAVLKRVDMIDGMSVNPRLASLLDDRHLRGVIDHFVNVLDQPRHDLYRCATDVDNILVPRLRAINRPIAVFVDNVDEYFNKHVRAVARSSDAGEISPNIWYYSQMGLVEVAYQLRRVNHHLKVFAAVRKEAFLKFDQMTSMVQQYRGSAIDIAYTPGSLREIFINNIKREKERNLVLPEKLRTNPIEAFLGRTKVAHPHTHEEEDAFDYISRHTLQRPRDFMTIGQKLSDLPAGERRLRDRFKEVVNHAAAEIATEYVNEIAPYLGPIDVRRVLARVPSNVLTRDEVELIFLEHNSAVDPGGEWAHIFCMLYRAGLLGFLEMNHVTGRRTQRFLAPGEGLFEPDGVLPSSPHYLIHPVLTGIVARLNPAYGGAVDTMNIVGNGRPWKEPTDHVARTLMVVRGDIDGFGLLMQRGLDAAVRDALRRAVDAFGSDCLHASPGDGDALLIVDHRVLTLIKCARRIMEDVSEAPGSPRVRMAVAAGPVQVHERADGSSLIEGGAAVLIASRIEPLVRPGEIWITEDVRDMLAASDTIFRAEPIGADAALETRSDGCVNVKKRGSDEDDIWVRLYRIVS